MEERRWHRFYEEGVSRSLDYAGLTIPEILQQTSERYPDRPALIFRNGRLTYRELQEQVDRLAGALGGLGVEKGTRVALHLPNLPQTLIAYFATVQAGGIVVMTNPLYTGPEIRHQWEDAGARVAITLDALFERRLKPIREKLPIRDYIITSIPDYLGFPLNWLARFKLSRMDPPKVAKVSPGPGIHDWSDLIEGVGPNSRFVEIGLDEVAMLQYTGGTTGISKGAMLTHRNVSCNAQQLAAWNQGVEPGAEIMLSVLPFFHIYGLTVAMVLPVSVGATILVMPDPRDTDGILKSIVKHRVTLFPAVPAIYMAINERPDIGDYDLSSVKICNSGSAPLPVDVLERFEELTGARIAEGYGLTEASPVTHSNPVFGQRKVGSIGIPLPDTDVRIIDLDDSDREVPDGEEGELLIRGPQVMKGYWKRPDETDATLRDGWLHTGDIARMDEDGYHYIVGRVKDMILASGYNIYPDEIDRVLSAHPAVVESATIGVPDEKRGETVKSFIVPKPGQQPTEDELIAYCRENLAAYKIPRIIEFRDELPKSTVLKVLRRELRDEEPSEPGPREPEP